MIINPKNSAEFNEAINSDKPTLVDFYADWCGPCKMMEPLFTNVANDANYNAKINFLKLNVDNVGDIAQKYQITSIPTTAIFQNGKIVGEKKVGFMTQQNIEQFINDTVK